MFNLLMKGMLLLVVFLLINLRFLTITKFSQKIIIASIPIVKKVKNDAFFLTLRKKVLIKLDQKCNKINV